MKWICSLWILSLIFSGCVKKEEVPSVKQEEEVSNVVTYEAVYHVLDDGPHVDQIVFDFPKNMESYDLSVDSFDTDVAIESVEVDQDQVVLHLATLDVEPTFMNLLLDEDFELVSNGLASELDLFGYGESSSGLKYRDFEPSKGDAKHPLIIWLHGAGETGTDNVSHIAHNRGAVAFIQEDVQELFDFPYVLAPQASEHWMEEFHCCGGVMYGKNQTDHVVTLIREYMDAHENIDVDRVYIGGCSMGGYQTWETLFAAPELFAAAFPMCAAYDVPKDKLPLVKDIPIWMAHCSQDTVVPVQYSRNAYANLKELSDCVYYSEFADTSYNGKMYTSHAVWVPVLRNVPENEEGVHLFEWLASQRK